MSAVQTGQDKYSSLLEAAALPARVSNFTHGFYRYPARFGERFVREAISSLSRSGDLVLDPFCGGGTTVVEALALGRKVVGLDVSELALFVSRVKTTPLSDRQLTKIRKWVAEETEDVSQLLRPTEDALRRELSGIPGLFRNLLANLCSTIAKLPRGECQRFARALVLKTAQWALDGKQEVPRPTQFVQRLHVSLELMSAGMRDFTHELGKRGLTKSDVLSRLTLSQIGASSFSQGHMGAGNRTAQLLLTSPPYLGVHVLYNKWQVEGRRETRAPFYIANVDDIGSASNYTLISRSSKSGENYFKAIHDSFKSTGRALSDKAYVVQLVSFADAESALPKYLESLATAGLDVCDVYASSVGELRWRSVPSRRWYARVGAINDSAAAQEVLLVHRKRR
jgi:hypothetical protein